MANLFLPGTGNVVYAAVGAVAGFLLLLILVLVSVKTCMKSKSQPLSDNTLYANRRPVNYAPAGLERGLRSTSAAKYRPSVHESGNGATVVYDFSGKTKPSGHHYNNVIYDNVGAAPRSKPDDGAIIYHNPIHQQEQPYQSLVGRYQQPATTTFTGQKVNNVRVNEGSKSKMNRRGSDCKATEAKLVVSGKMGVGKSALVVRYLTKRFIWEYDPTLALVVRYLTRRFIWEYDPTLEFSYKHQTLVDDDVVSMEILDTAGQLYGDNRRQWEGHVRWGDGFLLVYSVTDKQSFHDVGRMKEFLDEAKKPRNVTAVILANKMDLKHERCISTDEGEKLAQELSCGYFEGSALLGDGVISEAIEELCREVRRRKMMENRTRRRSSSQMAKQVFSRVLTKIYNS
uniref:small monomeric GTPase n=1 Tax=Branchiostoma floridae TaxID=7739 RepID=C3Y512_BRAFL|eukprot:XP_002608535.1 hypothetical protein BRAFLDRAFT_92366 [Branchiostoma floridae]